MKYELPHIVAAKGSHCEYGLSCRLGWRRVGAAYHASKHGVVGITKAAAMEYADKVFASTPSRPAWIHTPMAERAFFHDAAIAARVTALRIPWGEWVDRKKLPTQSSGSVLRVHRSPPGTHFPSMGASWSLN
jgi:NAD(P)-dependent dehydrogenase (short-subunit alcohol dehydrogenase family)